MGTLAIGDTARDIIVRSYTKCSRIPAPSAKYVVYATACVYTELYGEITDRKARPNDRNIQRNISQHCWAQRVARVWPPCCDMLRVVGSSLKLVKFEPTAPNMSQHIATRWPNARNMLRPTMLRYVELACCDRLAGALSCVANLSLVLILKPLPDFIP